MTRHEGLTAFHKYSFIPVPDPHKSSMTGTQNRIRRTGGPARPGVSPYTKESGVHIIIVRRHYPHVEQR